MKAQSMSEWLKEATVSLADALKKAERSEIPVQNLYMLAPLLYSEKFNTRNDSLLQEMTRANDEQVAQDWSHDEKSKFQYKFHYVSSYLFCFVVAGKIDEMQYDRIMEVVCNEMDLFASDYASE